MDRFLNPSWRFVVWRVRPGVARGWVRIALWPTGERSTRPPRHSRVCSSTIETCLTGRPSAVANCKSAAETRVRTFALGTFT